ncbi:cation:proton antiporter [Clostridium ganghwense]|uniref:Cation:proton antiporter n=1 Tax=Clostridium ganghwense TaxID=312089 RepID=A0ABT4CJ99_9CLOT|nr:cation:proton antiporter [Clostridium ganghwense]MCY6369128.1 cation:proton antiporter [Clostridium ganghwense]
MAEAINYDSLLILTIFAFITPIFVNAIKKFRIPFVVGEIFVGIIIGKSFLNLVHEDIWISFLSHLGLAYLMFLSGLEIDIDRVRIGKEKKKVALRVLMCFGMFGISLLVSYLMCKPMYKLGIIKDILFMTFLFTAAAPGLIVPFLKERGILNTDYGQLLLIYTLICEFVCLIALTLISSTITHGLTYKNFLFIILFIAAFIIFKIIEKTSHIFDLSSSFFSNLHIGVRAAFALMLVLVTISDKIGTEIILGSFLAGFIFSLILDKQKEELKYELDILGYGFLIPIFFIMVGVNLDLSSILKNPQALLNIPLFLLVIFTVKLIPSLLMNFTYDFNKAISGAFIFSSQLSLLIVGAQMAYNLQIITAADYSSFVVTTVISCILFPLCFDIIFKSDNIKESANSSVNKICIMEIVPMNEELFDKSLKEIDFPYKFRVFMIVRNNIEILPVADTKILKGDRLIIAGLANKSEDVIKLLNG